MTQEVAYNDLILHDFETKKSARFLHMGHWDDPERAGCPSADELIVAQARMDELVLSMLDVHDGMSVADVGCGLGGSIETLDRRHEALGLVGVNLAKRQLDVARALQTRPSNGLIWVQGDGCQLPLRTGSLDRVLCLEALPHFASRSAFFSEVARVLRPGGLLALADLVFLPGAAASIGLADEDLARRLDQHFGPWVAPFGTLDEVDVLAEAQRLLVVDRLDATRHTAPTHLVAFAESPKTTEGYDEFLATIDLFGRLHRAGQCVYTYTSYRLEV